MENVPMAFETTVTPVSAYHNYKYNGVLKKEIIFGGEGDAFFIHARAVEYPADFPRLSLNFFSGDGALVAAIRENRVERLADGYREERGNDGMVIMDAGGGMVFRYRVVRHLNVYVTELSGALYDEKGNPVIL